MSNQFFYILKTSLCNLIGPQTAHIKKFFYKTHEQLRRSYLPTDKALQLRLDGVRRTMLVFEGLESRQLLAADLVITEVMYQSNPNNLGVGGYTNQVQANNLNLVGWDWVEITNVGNSVGTYSNSQLSLTVDNTDSNQTNVAVLGGFSLAPGGSFVIHNSNLITSDDMFGAWGASSLGQMSNTTGYSVTSQSSIRLTEGSTVHDQVLLNNSFPQPVSGIYASIFYTGPLNSSAKTLNDSPLYWAVTSLAVPGAFASNSYVTSNPDYLSKNLGGELGSPGTADHSLAATGDFSHDHKVITPFGTLVDVATSVQSDSTGKIIVAGYSQGYVGSTDFAVSKYLPNGAIDSTFGVNGKVTTPIGSSWDAALDAAIQSDDKIVLVGGAFGSTSRDFAVVRYNVDGTLDTSFSVTGKVTTDVSGFEAEAWSVAIQGDGKIVVAGYTSSDGLNKDFAIVRYNADGSLDSTFGSGGKVITPVGTGDDYISSVAIQSDGKIVVAGASQTGGIYGFAVARYLSNGMLDSSFGAAGISVTPIGSSNAEGSDIKIDSHGNLWVAGLSQASNGVDFTLVRYDTNGALDTSFSTDGINTTDFDNGADVAESIQILSDGRAVVVGRSDGTSTQSDFAIAVYKMDGSLDTAFETGGKLKIDFDNRSDGAHDAVLVNSGQLIAVGSTDTIANGSLFALALVDLIKPIIVESGGTTQVSENAVAAQRIDSFTVALNAAPVSDVVMTVISSDVGEATVSPATLTFTPTNWNIPQNVTVTGVFDNIADGDQMISVTLAVNDALSDVAYHSVEDVVVDVAVLDVPNRPVTTSIANGTTATPTIFFDDVSGETNYSLVVLDITSASAFEAYRNDAIAANSISFTIPAGANLQAGHVYRAFLFATNANGYSSASGLTSPAFQFTQFTVGAPVTIPAPPSGVSVTNSNTSTPTISWPAVAGATSYSIWFINTSTSPTSVVSGATGITGTSYTHPTNLSPSSYRIWVRAANSAGLSAYSSPFDFSVGAPIVPPSAPAGLSVTGNSTPNPTVQWNTTAGATSYSIWFINLSTTPTALVSDAGGIATNQYSHSTALPDGLYRIWVKATNPAGSSAFSAPFDFSVGAPIVPPAVPSGLSVTDNNTLHPTIHWNAVSGASSYSIWFIDLSTTPATLVSGATGLVANSYQHSGALAEGNYRIWVKATNVAGTSPFSALFDFLVAAPQIPTFSGYFDDVHDAKQRDRALLQLFSEDDL